MIKVERIYNGMNVLVTDEGEEYVYPLSIFPADVKIGEELEYNVSVPCFERVGT